MEHRNLTLDLWLGGASLERKAGLDWVGLVMRVNYPLTVDTFTNERFLVPFPYLDTAFILRILMIGMRELHSF